MRTYSSRRGLCELIEDVQERCRLCLARLTEKIPIFNETTSLRDSLAVKIMLCVGFEMSPEEGLPKFICTECFKKVNQCCEFKKKCSLVSLKLKSHMTAIKLKEIQNTEVTEPKKTDSQFKAPEEKRQKMFSYEDLVAKTLSQTDYEVPVQVNPNSMLQPAVACTENTQMITEEVPVKVQETVIKCLPKQIIKERTPSPEPQPPDMSKFLSSVLLELKVLYKNGNDILLKDSSLRTVEVETGDETVITLDMFQVEEEVPIVTENSQTIEEQENTKKDQATQSIAYSQPMCAQCGKRFASSSALRRHARVHTGERPYECAVCNRGFAQKEVLARHVLVHNDERPHKCSKCPKSFTQRTALESHERSHAAPHQRPLAIHNCTKCSKVFLHASGLSRHMMTHNGRKFECASCSRRFNDQSSLLRHLRVMHRMETRPQTVITTNPSAVQKQGGGVCT